MNLSIDKSLLGLPNDPMSYACLGTNFRLHFIADAPERSLYVLMYGKISLQER
ncbi:MAG: hypothetical protein ACTMH4_14595 [Sphingobacterium sp.]